MTWVKRLGTTRFQNARNSAPAPAAPELRAPCGLMSFLYPP
jgi:hypothetical protein